MPPLAVTENGVNVKSGFSPQLKNFLKDAEINSPSLFQIEERKIKFRLFQLQPM